MQAGSVSLALHGGLLLLVAVLTGEHVVHAPRQAIELTSIEVLDPAPPPPPGPAPVARSAVPSVGVGGRARRQQIQRPQPSVPAAKSSLVDLKVGYDDPTSFTDRAATTADGAGDAGRSGLGAGIDRQIGDGVANIQIPQPSAVSLARPPRPRFDYQRLRLNGASKFAGRIIKVVLGVDPRGRVRDVRLLQGVDRDLDRRTIALVHDFEFEPALDEAGVAIRGTSQWNIEIVEDDDSEPFRTRFDASH